MLRKTIIFARTDEMLALTGRSVQYVSQMALVLVMPAVLSPDIFVQFSLIMPLAALGMTIVFGWMTGAVYRHIFELFDPNDKRFVQTVIVYYGLASLGFTILFFGGLLVSESIYRILPLILVAGGLKMAVIGALNACGNHRGFFAVNIGFAINTAMLIVLCIWDSESLEKNLILYAIADVCISVVAWKWAGLLKLKPRPIFNTEIALRYFHYGMPLLANSLAVWVISLSDRYILTIWESTESVASYILSYQLSGNIISVPLAFAATVFFPKILRLNKEKGKVEALSYTTGLLNRYLRFSAIIFVAASVLVMLFVYYIYSDYDFNLWVIVIVVLAHVIYGTAHFYNKEFELDGRVLVITKAVTTGALLNILLNFLLIPLIGVVGAAISTLLAYSTVIWRLRIAKNIVRPD